MVLLIVFSFVSCKKENTDETQTTYASYTEESSYENMLSQNEEVTDAVLITNTAEGSATTEELSVENVPVETDPSEWTDEEIVAFYKNAAIKSKKLIKILLC